MKTVKRYFVAEHFEATAKRKSMGYESSTNYISYLGKQCTSLPYKWVCPERDSIILNYSYSTAKGAKNLIEKDRKKTDYRGQYTRVDEVIELSIEYDEKAENIRFNHESAKVIDTVYIGY